MPTGLHYIAADNLSDLVAEFFDGWMSVQDPRDALRPITVVVPGPLMGQWFEQAIASKYDDDNGGVAAALDIIFPSTFLSRVLYGNNDGFGRFQGQSCALGLLEGSNTGRRLSLTDAMIMGRNLSDIILYRPELLPEDLADSTRTAERQLIADLLNRGIDTPWNRSAVGPHDVNSRAVVAFGCEESHIGGLLPEVLKKVSSAAPVLVANRRFAVEWVGEATELQHWTEGERRILQVWEDRLGLQPRDVSSGKASTTRAKISLHGCVGAARQVEVARDLILQSLDSGVSPHEIRVVTMNASLYAPLIKSLWLNYKGAPGVQFEIADPSFTRSSERLDALTCILDVMHSSFTRSDLVALLSHPVIVSKIGLDDDEADRLIRLASADGVSIGLSGETRRDLKIYEPDDDGGTWRRFSDRLLAASIFEPGNTDGSVELWPAGEANDANAAAALASLISMFIEWSSDVKDSKPIEGWVKTVEEWSEIIGARAGVIDNGVEKVLRSLAKLNDITSVPVTYEEFLLLFRNAVAGVGGPSTFGRGGVVVQDLYSLCNAPFAVTCVLGFDEQYVPSDSVLPHLGEAKPGDPSVRAKFRTALLGQISSTSEVVAILYDDRSLKSNRYIDRPISLLEIEAGCRSAGLAVQRRRHPRHPFSFDFAVDDSKDIAVQPDVGRGKSEPFTFSSLAPTLAEDLAQRGFPSVEHDMPIVTTADDAKTVIEMVDIRAIESCIKNPQSTFLRSSFGGAYIPSTDSSDLATPRLEIKKGLEQWSFRDELLQKLLEGDGIAEINDHSDGQLGSIAPGLQKHAVSELGTAAIAHLVKDISGGLSFLSGTRNQELGRGASFATGKRGLVIKRPEAAVFDTRAGLLVLDQTVSKRFTSRFWLFALQVAATTLQSRRPVNGVLLGQPKESTATETKPGLQTPFLVVDPMAPEEALHFLLAMQTFVDRISKVFPSFAPRSALAVSQYGGTLKRFLGESDSLESSWSGGDYTPAPGEGEQPAAKLLMPFDHVDLQEFQDGAFISSADEFCKLFSLLRIRKNETSKNYETWYESLQDLGGV